MYRTTVVEWIYSRRTQEIASLASLRRSALPCGMPHPRSVEASSDSSNSSLERPLSAAELSPSGGNCSIPCLYYTKTDFRNYRPTQTFISSAGSKGAAPSRNGELRPSSSFSSNFVKDSDQSSCSKSGGGVGLWEAGPGCACYNTKTTIERV